MKHYRYQAVGKAVPFDRVHAQQAPFSSTDTVRTAHVVLTHTSGVISHCRGLWGPPGTAFRYTFDLAGDAGKLQYDSAADTGIVFDAVAARSEERRVGKEGISRKTPSRQCKATTERATSATG